MSACGLGLLFGSMGYERMNIREGGLMTAMYRVQLRQPIDSHPECDDAGSAFHLKRKLTIQRYRPENDIVRLSRCSITCRACTHSSIVAYSEQCIRFANTIQARTYRSALQPCFNWVLPGKAPPVGGRAEGDCAPVTCYRNPERHSCILGYPGKLRVAPRHVPRTLRPKGLTAFGARPSSLHIAFDCSPCLAMW